ncbi:MAG: glycosyltransferase [Gemmatimonadota bacterium]|nr:glycosyltransferase [Gemmatimonadota bacterium]
MTRTETLLVFSHLRWDFVYQRPQHLLSRLASRGRVLYIEEPVAAPVTAEARWHLTRPAPGVLVCRPEIPGTPAGFGSAVLPVLQPMLASLLESEGVEDTIAWLYTPMALPLADSVSPVLMVYDCMDELSLFLGAPPELLLMEQGLLHRADLVFTGGVSLYRSKRERHPSVHCFPSSVEAAHFRRAAPPPLGEPLDEPADQAVLPRPRLGYYGVIDERMDLALIAAIADAHPDWSIVLVGPVVKIDPATLPRRPNIHYTGQRTYDELPSYLAGWDVCLMPFALNDATRFISPTKTLEYMAAERPIVSTPITDVAEPYGHVVRIAGTPEEFIAACEAALRADSADRARRVAAMRAVLARTSWHDTASRMGALIDDAVQRAVARPA